MLDATINCTDLEGIVFSFDSDSNFVGVPPVGFLCGGGRRLIFSFSFFFYILRPLFVYAYELAIMDHHSESPSFFLFFFLTYFSFQFVLTFLIIYFQLGVYVFCVRVYEGAKEKERERGKE